MKLTKNQRDFIMDQLTQEASAELGIELGGNQTARLNGKVGGQVVKRLLAIAEEALVYAEEKRVR